jgi:hypothetical protein
MKRWLTVDTLKRKLLNYEGCTLGRFYDLRDS